MVLLSVSTPTISTRLLSPVVRPWPYCAYAPATAGLPINGLMGGMGAGSFGGAQVVSGAAFGAVLVGNRIGQSYVSGVPPL